MVALGSSLARLQAGRNSHDSQDAADTACLHISVLDCSLAAMMGIIL